MKVKYVLLYKLVLSKLYVPDAVICDEEGFSVKIVKFNTCTILTLEIKLGHIFLRYGCFIVHVMLTFWFL